MGYYKIAVLLTFHNRKEKTLRCISSLYNALDHYHSVQQENNLLLELFLTDDGSTDGTSECIAERFGNSHITIIQGDGNLFWAGGMRKAWNTALDSKIDWDFYLLLNDDVELMPNVFDELFDAHQYAIEHYGREGVYSGITCDPNDHNKMTYGGNVWTNRLLAKSVRLFPSGEPQLCDVTNANILMVSNSVVKKIGIFYKGYVHGSADQDYSDMARKNKLPVLLTAHFCGLCENDHIDPKVEQDKIMNMSFKQRKAYFKHPLHSTKEQIVSEWRMTPLRAPLTIMGRLLILYCPRFYFKINNIVR